MKKWLVYKSGDLIGEMDARGIRQALRLGEVDPFDTVMPVGSNRKFEIVEVDEIFQDNDSGDASASDAENRTQIGTSRPSMTADFLNDAGNSNNVDMESTKIESPQLHTKGQKFDSEIRIQKPSTAAITPELQHQTRDAHTIMEARVHGAAPPRSVKKKIKRYFLIDKAKRVLGPVSGDEILSLYRRGIIANSVKVQVPDSDKKITIRQFISSYSGRKFKDLYTNSSNARSPSSRVLNEMNQVVKSRRLIKKQGMVLKLILAFTLGLGAVFAYKHLKTSEFSSERSSDPKPLPQELPAPSQPVQERPRLKKKKASLPPRPSKKAVSVKPKVSPPYRRVVKQARRPESVAVGRRRSKGPIAVAKQRPGGVVTVGPLMFDQRDLINCPAKCNMIFRDRAGDTLQGVFFKAAYFDLLKGRSQGITLVGRSRNDGNKLIVFIQDLK